MRSSTTKITCDYAKNGTLCGKEFLLPDPPEHPTAGTEDIVQILIVLNGENVPLHFCSLLHAIGYLTALYKSKKDSEQPKKVSKTLTAPQLLALKEMGIIVEDKPESRAHVAMEELEGIPPVPDNLSID